MLRWWHAAALGLLLPVAACGAASSDHPIGIHVARITEACQALTPEEVGDVAHADGVRLQDDFAPRSAYSVGRECVYENDAKLNVQPGGGYFIVVLTVERDPDGTLYEDYRTSARDAVPTGFGDDQGFEGSTRIGVRHGVWCVVATKGVNDKDDAYRELVRRFVSRLPLNHQATKA
jgi:hypothetical protein